MRMAELRLCRLDELPDPGTRGFSVRTGNGVQDIFVVRQGTAVHAYKNSCPHTGSPLDWQPDEFLNLDRTLIQCATHAALFRIEDGECVAGPCAGQALTTHPVRVDAGWILIDAVEIL